ncbi:MAG: hypothetical protein KAR06_01665 [Deltaproteobacteria bacterium]|nr:hypothetical protein [Deltaproteobacteria bacterium]
MEQFNPATECPKCGSTNAGSHYYQENGYETYEEQYKPERIERTCVVCSYRWDESPLDPEDTDE